MATFTQLAHCLVVLFRLTTFEAPGIPWDKQRIVRELDFGEVVRTWANRWNEVAQLLKLNGETLAELEEYPWFCAKKTLSFILNVWETKILPKLNSETTVAVAIRTEAPKCAEALGVHSQPDDMDFSIMTTNFSDDTFIREVFEGGFEYFDQFVPDLLRSP
jgi:hypothetical protein